MEKVKQYIEANKDRFLEELFELIRIPSISSIQDHKPDMVKTAEALKAALLAAGCDKAEVMPSDGNPVVFAEKLIDSAKPTVLVYAHYDVMPVDPIDLWETKPFEPVVKDGKIWARGADDDKGQGYMHIKAFEAMVKTDSLPCNSFSSVSMSSLYRNRSACVVSNVLKSNSCTTPGNCTPFI